MVKRWRVKWDETEIPDGDYVHAADYAEAVRRIAELEALLHEMHKSNDVLAARAISGKEAATEPAPLVVTNQYGDVVDSLNGGIQ